LNARFRHAGKPKTHSLKHAIFSILVLGIFLALCIPAAGADSPAPVPYSAPATGTSPESGLADLGAQVIVIFFHPFVTAYDGISSVISGPEHTASSAETTPVPGSGAVLGTPALSEYQIVWITDTQHLSRSHPEKYTALTTWIADAARNRSNVKMVVHTGDIVDNWNDKEQWKNANAAMEILQKNHVPYTWNAGNHDCRSSACSPHTYIGDRYPAFDPALVSRQESANWLGTYDNGTSNAVSFTAENTEFVIVNIEYAGDDAVLQWAGSVLSAHPRAYGIIATHAFLNSKGAYEDDNRFAGRLKTEVLDKNPRVFLILNGHYHTKRGFATQEMLTNHTVRELMFDRQDEEGGTGANAVTLLDFTVRGNQTEVRTQTIDLNTNETLASWSFTTPGPA
jgi:3',5'-cyclic AMP phosphodiesterase CpdA